MQAFIKPYQYHFLETQVETLLQSQTHMKDPSVLKALHAVIWEKVDKMFDEMTDEQKQLFQPLQEAAKDKVQAKAYLLKLKDFVIPLNAPSDKGLQKLFPKVKKLKLPKWEEIDLSELSYIGWDDPGQQCKYIVVEHGGKIIGIRGTFKSSNHTGVCAICHQHAELGLFMAETQRSGDGTYVKKGNYICSDSIQCNRQLTQLEKLQDFVEIVKKKK